MTHCCEWFAERHAKIPRQSSPPLVSRLSRLSSSHSFRSPFTSSVKQTPPSLRCLCLTHSHRESLKTYSHFLSVEYPSKLLSACTSRLTSKPNLCVGISCKGRAPLLLGERELFRGGGCPSFPAFNIAEMLGIVWPELGTLWAAPLVCWAPASAWLRGVVMLLSADVEFAATASDDAAVFALASEELFWWESWRSSLFMLF